MNHTIYSDGRYLVCMSYFRPVCMDAHIARFQQIQAKPLHEKAILCTETAFISIFKLGGHPALHDLTSFAECRVKV